MTKNLIKVSHEDKDIVIKIPLDLLIASQRYRDDGYKIIDKEAMIQYIVENLAEFDEDETGCTTFGKFIDEMLDYAYEWGEEWLEELSDEDCD